MSREKEEISTKDMTRLTPLKIYKLLKDESSPDHPLPTSYILARLEESGTKITRQTMYKDIQLLQEMNFDINCDRHRANEYYLVQEEFNKAEQRILIDTVQSAHFIPEEKARELAFKVASLSGAADARDFLKTTLQSPNEKYANKHIYYYLTSITDAISYKRKITFNYFDYTEKMQKKYRNEKRLYEENPVATVCSGNNYYLLVYNERHEKIITYRIDRMENVDVSAKGINVPENVEELAKDYLNTSFSMFAGEKTRVTLQADSDLVNSIFDMFGKEVHFTACMEEGKVRFHATAQIAPTFFSWVAGFGGRMKIVSPMAVVQEFCDFLYDNLSQYPPCHTRRRDNNMQYRKRELSPEEKTARQEMVKKRTEEMKRRRLEAGNAEEAPRRRYGRRRPEPGFSPDTDTGGVAAQSSPDAAAAPAQGHPDTDAAARQISPGSNGATEE